MGWDVNQKFDTREFRTRCACGSGSLSVPMPPREAPENLALPFPSIASHRTVQHRVNRSSWTMSTPRCQYHRRSASRRQQRHYWWYASFVAVFGLVLVFLVRSLRRRALSHLYLHPALALNADAAKGVRCADSPADCEAAAPFIFDSTYALGKQWPNTYGPNGHSVVPVTFPPMPLYHAKQYAGPMKKPTWFAFDA
jgi:hypothetical protein